jgi:hypothetical protein
MSDVLSYEGIITLDVRVLKRVTSDRAPTQTAEGITVTLTNKRGRRYSRGRRQIMLDVHKWDQNRRLFNETLVRLKPSLVARLINVFNIVI